MTLSKGFEQWWESELKKHKIPRNKVFADKVQEWDMKSDIYFINIGMLYAAFKAHDEELNRLRKFEKKFRTLQKICQEYGQKMCDYWNDDTDKSIKYEMKYDETLEEFLYL